MTTDTLTVGQHRDETGNNMPVPMETEVVEREPMSALDKLKEELKTQRNLDVGFETTDFNIAQAIEMILQLDKYTKISVLNGVKFYLNMQCIRQALRILPEDIEKTVEGREQYDHLIAYTMDEYEKDGDYATKLPAFIALNEHLRVLMYDDMLEPSTMESTLEFLTRDKPTTTLFEKDYDARVAAGQRPGLSKRDFCALQLEDAMKSHRKMEEYGQAAIEFCNDLKVNEDRGFGDLPDWAVDALYNKIVDKLTHRWGKLDIRRTGTRTKPADASEAQADQMLVEFVYKELTGREFATEY